MYRIYVSWKQGEVEVVLFTMHSPYLLREFVLSLSSPLGSASLEFEVPYFHKSPTELYAVATTLTLWATCTSKAVRKEKKNLWAGITDPDHHEDVGLMLYNKDRKE